MTTYNFSAGPAMLPAEVIEQIRADLPIWHWQGVPQGASVLEVSHRGAAFEALIHQAEQDLRELLAIPAHYKVLFMQGGAWGQFACVPMNLLRDGERAGFIVSGGWSKSALGEAAKFGATVRLASSEAEGFNRLPQPESWLKEAGELAYVHLCSNETVHGNEWHDLLSAARSAPAPLVVDASSHFLSRPLPVAECGLIFAGAQKNVGPAGVTIVIVREDWLGRSGRTLPSVFDYTIMAKQHSLFNTPPTFAIYVTALTLAWIKAQGGLAAMEQRAIARSQRLYAALDASALWRAPVDPACRSRMNVVFSSGDEAVDAAFVRFAEARGLLALKGHRSRGGLRASIYNAMPIAGVEALIAAMEEFERLPAAQRLSA